jgi:hypothetical protein
MKWLIFIFLTIGSTIFGAYSNKSMKYEMCPAEKAVKTVMARNSKTIAEKYHLRPVGIGIAMPEGDIRSLELEFQIFGPLSKEQIRNILIHSAHDFLSDINADSNLCTYLKNHSLTINDIGITLYLIDSSGRGLRDPNFSIASILKGELEYDILIDIYDEEIKIDIPRFKTKIRETYEEALSMYNS